MCNVIFLVHRSACSMHTHTHTETCARALTHTHASENATAPPPFCFVRPASWIFRSNFFTCALCACVCACYSRVCAVFSRRCRRTTSNCNVHMCVHSLRCKRGKSRSVSAVLQRLSMRERERATLAVIESNSKACIATRWCTAVETKFRGV